jgi:3-phytase
MAAYLSDSSGASAPGGRADARQKVGGLDRPNNVDVEYGLLAGGRRVDIVVVTEHLQQRLRVFRVAPDGRGIADISSLDKLRVFAGRRGEASAPMGIGLYRRPRA